jgi:hypothetical protein
MLSFFLTVFSTCGLDRNVYTAIGCAVSLLHKKSQFGFWRAAFVSLADRPLAKLQGISDQ